MDSRIGNRAIWVIRASAIVAVIVWLLAYFVISPGLDQPLVARIKRAAESELARIPGPPEAILEGTEVASGTDSMSVYARYSTAVPASAVRGFYDKSLQAAGWTTGHRAGYYRREDFCLRINSSGQGGFEVELAWRREWCGQDSSVPMFSGAAFAAGLGQFGLVLFWLWLQHFRRVDSEMLGQRVVNDPRNRLAKFRRNPEVGVLAVLSTAVGGLVISLGMLVVAVVLATNSWLLMTKWQ